MKREASLQRFLHQLKQKKIVNETEYDQLHPSVSAPVCFCGTPEMHKLSSSDSFPKPRPVVWSIGTWNYNLARFLCDFISALVPNDYSCKDFFFLKLKMQTFPKNFLFPAI